jgi:ankyrin repeat protein
LNNKSEKEYQIVEMFLSYGADPNIAHKTAGTTPLIQAVFKADVRLVKLFLEHGADLDLKDNQGRTALDIAKKKNYLEVIDLLQ